MKAATLEQSFCLTRDSKCFSRPMRPNVPVDVRLKMLSERECLMLSRRLPRLRPRCVLALPNAMRSIAGGRLHRCDLLRMRLWLMQRR